MEFVLDQSFDEIFAVNQTSKPLEVLKVLHSFDPCLACAVHVIDAQGKELSKYKIKTL